jgi:hypothetical protein
VLGRLLVTACCCPPAHVESHPCPDQSICGRRSPRRELPSSAGAAQGGAVADPDFLEEDGVRALHVAKNAEVTRKLTLTLVLSNLLVMRESEKQTGSRGRRRGGDGEEQRLGYLVPAVRRASGFEGKETAREQDTRSYRSRPPPPRRS